MGGRSFGSGAPFDEVTALHMYITAVLPTFLCKMFHLGINPINSLVARYGTNRCLISYIRSFTVKPLLECVAVINVARAGSGAYLLCP